ncbi:MAG TPA: hypothetical protein VJH89_04325 [Patescibacteria group bacterium]|nr:hypothetical protein [Patescibacteria group bacterium]
MHNSSHDQNFDHFIRARMDAQKDCPHMIEPSQKFCDRVMKCVTIAEQRRQRMTALWFITLTITPIATRFLWETLRNDGFSAVKLPMSTILIPMYHALISPLVIYALIALGGIIAFYTVGFPRWKRM